MSKRRVLFIGDLHADDRQPSSRKDDYLSSITGKLRESLEIAEHNNVDAVVMLGDVFHRIDPGGSCRNAVLAVLLSNWSFPVYVTEGNHDRQNPHQVTKSALGTLIEAGALISKSYEPELKIGFAHFNPNIEDEIRNGCLTKQEDAIIWAAHAYISTIPLQWDHNLFKNIPVSSKVKLVVAGHLHHDMEEVRDDGVIFVNPGSLCRNEHSDFMIRHRPKVFVVDYDIYTGDIISTQYFYLKSALKSEDIFRIEERKAQKDAAADTRRYIQQISALTNLSFSGDKYQSLRDAGKARGVSTDIIEHAVSTLQKINDGEIKTSYASK